MDEDVVDDDDVAVDDDDDEILFLNFRPSSLLQLMPGSSANVD